MQPMTASGAVERITIGGDGGACLVGKHAGSLHVCNAQSCVASIALHVVTHNFEPSVSFDPTPARHP